MSNKTEDAVRLRALRKATAKQVRSVKLGLNKDLLIIKLKRLALFFNKPGLIRKEKLLIKVKLLKIKIMLIPIEGFLYVYDLAEKLCIHIRSLLKKDGSKDDKSP